MPELFRCGRLIGSSLLIFVFGFCLSAQAANELAPLPRLLHTNLLCESMLWTRSQHTGTAAPLELDNLFGQLMDIPLKPALRKHLRSYSLSFKDTAQLNPKQLETLEIIRSQLMTDLYFAVRTLPEVQTVYVAYRGEQAVKDAYREFRSELASGVGQIESRSERIYRETSPSARKVFSSRSLTISAILAILYGSNTIGPESAAILGSGLLGTTYGLDLLYRKFWSNFLTSNFQEHLQVIEASLAKHSPVTSAAVSRISILPTKVHRNFMALGEEELSEESIQSLLNIESNAYRPVGAKNIEHMHRQELTKDAKTSREKIAKLQEIEMRERINEPTGTRRMVGLNSYYFWDDKTNEPVWVLTYTAKNVSNRRGWTRKKKEKEETESKWEWGLAPVPSR